MKRQRGRNRGGGGGQGGGKPQHNINRAFDSQGPDNVRVRGNAQSVYEKYQALARDATSAGDRVLTENHLQHAEHYFRTLRAIQPNRPASEIVSRDSFSSGYDIDFEDEAVETAMEEADAQAAARAAEVAAQSTSGVESGAEPPRFDRNVAGAGQGERREWRDRPERQDRADRPQGEFRDRGFNGERNDRQDRFAGDRPQGEFRGERQGQNQNSGGGEFRDRGDRPRFRDRDDRYRQEREPRNDGDRPREDRPRDDRTRDDRPYEARRDRFRERAERGVDERRFEGSEGEGAAAPALTAGAGVVEAAQEAPVLRSEDGGVSQLPHFLQPGSAAEGEGDARRRPRRRRAREDGEPSSTPEAAIAETAVEEA